MLYFIYKLTLFLLKRANMYFNRKIDNYLDDWFKNNSSTPALVVGIRQCGKTESIKEFAKRNHLQLI